MALPLNLRAFAEAVLPAPLFQRLSSRLFVEVLFE
jgi:hypothetical protein